mgnify:CR=1 FL=1
MNEILKIRIRKKAQHFNNSMFLYIFQFLLSIIIQYHGFIALNKMWRGNIIATLSPRVVWVFITIEI